MMSVFAPFSLILATCMVFSCFGLEVFPACKSTAFRPSSVRIGGCTVKSKSTTTPPSAACISARQPFRLVPSPCASHELCKSFQYSPPSSAAVAAPHEEQRHRVRALSKRDAVPFTCLLHLLHSTCSPPPPPSPQSAQDVKSVT